MSDGQGHRRDGARPCRDAVATVERADATVTRRVASVERMVKRGQLERGPSNAPATVSKRSLVAALEQRRRDVGHLARAAEIEQSGSGAELSAQDSPQDPRSALREVLVPVLAPLLDEFVAVRSRAAVLQSQLDSIKARAEQQRKRDELMFALATSGWWGRRKTRRAVLRHYPGAAEPWRFPVVLIQPHGAPQPSGSRVAPLTAACEAFSDVSRVDVSRRDRSRVGTPGSESCSRGTSSSSPAAARRPVFRQ